MNDSTAVSKRTWLSRDGGDEGRGERSSSDGPKRHKTNSGHWIQIVPDLSRKSSRSGDYPEILRPEEALLRNQFEITLATVTFPFERGDLGERDKKLISEVDLQFLLLLSESSPGGFGPKVFQKSLIMAFPEKIGMGYGWRYDKDFYIGDSLLWKLKAFFTTSILEVSFNPGGGSCGAESDRAYGVSWGPCYCDKHKMKREEEESSSHRQGSASSETARNQSSGADPDAWPRFIIWVARKGKECSQPTSLL